MNYTRHYEKFHKDDAIDINASFMYYEQNIRKFLPDNKEAKILDIGCGTGLLLEYLNSNGFYNNSGIEIDNGQAEKCIKKGLNVQVVDDSISFLNNHKNTFNIIVAADVLEHIPREFQLKFLISIKDSLTSNGFLICSVPNANSPLSSRWRYIDWTHHMLFTEISLDFVLFNSGFEKIEIYPMEYASKSFLKKILKFCLNKPMRIFHRLNYISELGVSGINVPISPNLLAKASK
ncbi:MAG: class I SAM-dependent methyltransferase [Bacteroidetes bacterium]|nr:MAG: class I SAM-dependent methyltransferase [Bacteroidota bacterium]